MSVDHSSSNSNSNSPTLARKVSSTSSDSVSSPHSSYKAKWEKEFPWLEPLLGNNVRAICSICDKVFSISGGITSVKQHSSSKQHKRKVLEKKPNDEMEPLTPNVDMVRMTMTKYMTEWEEENSWIAPVQEDEYKAKCNVCDKVFTIYGGLSDVKTHLASKQHIKETSEQNQNTQNGGNEQRTPHTGRKKKYNTEWEKQYFWIKSVKEDSFLAKCTVCDETFPVSNGLEHVRQHAATEEHLRLALEENPLGGIDDFDDFFTQSSEKMKEISDALREEADSKSEINLQDAASSSPSTFSSNTVKVENVSPEAHQGVESSVGRDNSDKDAPTKEQTIEPSAQNPVTTAVNPLQSCQKLVIAAVNALTHQKPVTTPGSPLSSQPVTTPGSPLSSQPVTTPGSPLSSQPVTTSGSPLSSQPVTPSGSLLSSQPVTTSGSLLSSQPVKSESPLSGQPVTASGSPLSSQPVTASGSLLSSQPVTTSGSLLSSQPVTTSGSLLSSQPVTTSGSLLSSLPVIKSESQPVTTSGIPLSSQPVNICGSLLSRQPVTTSGSLLSSQPVYTSGSLLSRQSVTTSGSPLSRQPVTASGSPLSRQPVAASGSLLSRQPVTTPGSPLSRQRVPTQGSPLSRQRVPPTQGSPLSRQRPGSNHSTPAKKAREIHIDLDDYDDDVIMEPPAQKRPRYQPAAPTVVHNPVINMNVPQNNKHILVVPNHEKSVMSNLSSLWKAGRLCDAIISNGIVNVKVHKMIFAAVCPKVLDMFYNTPHHKFPKVTFPNFVSKEALLAFADYMYKGVLNLDPDLLAQLIVVAQRLDMNAFEKLCSNQLAALRPQNIQPAAMEPILSEPCSSSGLIGEMASRLNRNPQAMGMAPASNRTPQNDNILTVNSIASDDTWNVSLSDSPLVVSAGADDNLMEVVPNFSSSDNNSNINIISTPIDPGDQQYRRKAVSSNVNYSTSNTTVTNNYPYYSNTGLSQSSSTYQNPNNTQNPALSIGRVWTQNNSDKGNTSTVVNPIEPFHF